MCEIVNAGWVSISASSCRLNGADDKVLPSGLDVVVVATSAASLAAGTVTVPRENSFKSAKLWSPSATARLISGSFSRSTSIIPESEMFSE